MCPLSWPYHDRMGQIDPLAFNTVKDYRIINAPHLCLINPVLNKSFLFVVNHYYNHMTFFRGKYTFFFFFLLCVCSPSLRQNVFTQCTLQNADIATNDRPPPYYPDFSHPGELTWWHDYKAQLTLQCLSKQFLLMRIKPFIIEHCCNCFINRHTCESSWSSWTAVFIMPCY